MRLLLFLTCLLLNLTYTFSTPLGAGGCAGNGPSLGSGHLEAESTDDFQVFDAYTVTVQEEGSSNVAAVELIEKLPFRNDQNTDIKTDTRYIVTVAQKTNYTALPDEDLVRFGLDPRNQFRGFLFRLSNLETKEDTTRYISLFNSSYSQISGLCTNLGVGGVTHVNNEKKSEVSMYLEVPDDGLYQLDVTVVIKNRVEETEAFGVTRVSQFGYTPYVLDVGGRVDLIEDTPAPAPTAGGGSTSSGPKRLGFLLNLVYLFGASLFSSYLV